MADQLKLSSQTRTRLSALLKRAEPGYRTSTEIMLNRPVSSLFDGANRLLIEQAGFDLLRLDPMPASRLLERRCSSSEEVVNCPDKWVIVVFVIACFAYLETVPPNATAMSAPDFENRLNEILEDGGEVFRLRGRQWIEAVSTATEAVRRALLAGEDEVAGCRQGDQQVTAVVSTVQDRLTKPGTIIIDYGVGLGRVLAGFATASKFKDATYIAVDAEISSSVRKLATEIGGTAHFMTRDEFLTNKVTGDVIMVVNTLHHIPFAEIPHQLSRVVTALKPDGFLLIHEMGELPDPEQRNVPWHVEDVLRLFGDPAFDVNPSTSTSRGRGIQLSNTIIRVRHLADFASILERQARAVWESMKERVLAEIRSLYDSRDRDRHVELQYALLTNANLDLNTAR